MEGLSVAKATLSAFLHPSRSDDVEEGVLQLLSSLLLRYNEEFDGVVLAYFDIKVCDWTPKILSGLHPYLSLKLKAKLLLFSPKPGMLLEGTVNKVEKDYIGAIVLGVFNAAIAFSDIHEDFSYQDNVNGTPFWASTSDNHVIGLGSKIKFVVKSQNRFQTPLAAVLSMPAQTVLLKLLTENDMIQIYKMLKGSMPLPMVWSLNEIQYELPQNI